MPPTTTTAGAASAVGRGDRGAAGADGEHTVADRGRLGVDECQQQALLDRHRIVGAGHHRRHHRPELDLAVGGGVRAVEAVDAGEAVDGAIGGEL